MNEEAAGIPVPLTPLLADSMVSWDGLADRYGPLLQLVDTLLGVVPNCGRYLEIWPPAFRTYNVLVPNLLNLPVPILGIGGPPPGVVGFAGYIASRSAGCAYCSAHSCSFAVRYGASPDKVAAALLPDGGVFTRGEMATIAVAQSLARIPCELTTAQRDELVEVYGERKAEWIVLAVSLMGFLNKFMDAVGVELEESLVAEVSGTLGPDWSPGKAGALLGPIAPASPAPSVDLWTKLRVLPLLPAAIRFDRRAQRGIPKRWPEVGQFLQKRTGHHFPVLERLHSGRARRAIASVLCENLAPGSSVVGLDVKVRAGATFAEVVANDRLAEDVRALARHHRVDLQAEGATSGALTLARAASYSPARIDANTVAACREAGLSAPAIVEIITWLAVLQMLHRLTCFTLPTT